MKNRGNLFDKILSVAYNHIINRIIRGGVAGAHPRAASLHPVPFGTGFALNRKTHIRTLCASYMVEGPSLYSQPYARSACGFLYTKNHAIVAWLKRGLPMSLEKKAPIV